MLQQTVAITAWTLANLRSRAFSSLVLVTATATVVLVTLGLLSMAQGLSAAVSTGSPERALVLGAGSNSEINGSISRLQLEIMRQLPGIRRDRNGQPLISGEIYASVNLPDADGELVSVAVRGMSVDALRVRPEVELTMGHPPRPGRFDLLVGQQIAAQFPAMKPGSAVQLKGQLWTVTGVFTSQGARSSEIWVDVDVMANIWRRGEFLQSALVQLESYAALDTIQRGLEDPRLNHRAWRESEFLAEQASSATGVLRVAALGVGLIMACGAVFAALNTLLATVDARRREVALLNALGFARSAVALSVVIEGVVLSVAGALGGATLAVLLFHGAAAQAAGGSLTQVAYSMQVSGSAIASAIAGATAIGLAGSSFPAFQAVRSSPIAAMNDH